MTDRTEQKLSSIKDYLIEQSNRINISLSENGARDYLQEIDELENARSEFIKKHRTVPVGCESFFAVLRKWNSYTPSLPTISKTSISQFSIGGGYYLYAQGEDNKLQAGYGLVIDPGYNFIHNFGQAGFSLDDIDGILITHAHNDHTNDFESILSLLYQRNDKFKGDKAQKKVDLYLNVGSFKKFSNYLDLTKKKTDEKNYIGKVTVMSPGQVIKVPKSEIDLEIFTLFTNHNEIVTQDYSLGICFKTSGRNILLTGDTGWEYDTAFKNNDFLLKHGFDVEGIDLMVPHLGSIKRTEFTDNDDFTKRFYGSHLGLLGTICAVEQWKPALCVISEFGEELIDVREKLVREIASTCKDIDPGMVCLPGDVGLILMLSSMKIACYVTKNIVDIHDIDYVDLRCDSINTIKYYNPAAITEVAEKENLLRGIKIENGISIIRKHYVNKLKNDFMLTDISVESLVREIKEVEIDFNTPEDVNENIRSTIGKLMLLTCYDNSSNNIKNAFSNNSSKSLVEKVLCEILLLDKVVIASLVQDN